jgi:hypothetical protein
LSVRIVSGFLNTCLVISSTIGVLVASPIISTQWIWSALSPIERECQNQSLEETVKVRLLCFWCSQTFQSKFSWAEGSQFVVVIWLLHELTMEGEWARSKVRLLSASYRNYN